MPDTKPLHRYATQPHARMPSRSLSVNYTRLYTPAVARRSPNPFRRWLRRIVLWAIAAIVLGIASIAGYILYVNTSTASLIYKTSDGNIPHNHVALVFGAGLNADGGPSAMLYDRIATAVDLYNGSKVDKLLMTGDNSDVDYNEVEAMRKSAVGMGVPDSDIVLDYAGFNTLDSCYRARDVFGLSAATLVTQRFHLPRALNDCNHTGVASIGVAADRQSYDTSPNQLREYPAILDNLLRLLTNDPPRFLGPKVDVDETQAR